MLLRECEQIIFSGLVDRLAFVHPHYISFPTFVGSALVLGSAIFGTLRVPLPSPSYSCPVR